MIFVSLLVLIIFSILLLLCGICTDRSDYDVLIFFHYTFTLMQKKLHVYLAPFLNATRYTSFGRHFTKVEKLEQVIWSCFLFHNYVKYSYLVLWFYLCSVTV